MNVGNVLNLCVLKDVLNYSYIMTGNKVLSRAHDSLFHHFCDRAFQGPVVQNVVSLTSLFVGSKC